MGPRPKENWTPSLHYSQEPLSTWLEKLRRRAVIWILFHPLGRQESQVYVPPKHLVNSAKEKTHHSSCGVGGWRGGQNPLETVVGYWVTKTHPVDWLKCSLFHWFLSSPTLQNEETMKILGRETKIRGLKRQEKDSWRKTLSAHFFFFLSPAKSVNRMPVLRNGIIHLNQERWHGKGKK